MSAGPFGQRRAWQKVGAEDLCVDDDRPRGAERGSRVNGRQERGALFLVDVLGGHLVVGWQRACAAKELFGGHMR
jgi:hypothetical protein